MPGRICRKAHRYAQLEKLPTSQKVAHRHVCAACAFEAGIAEGLRRAAHAIELETKCGRHTDSQLTFSDHESINSPYGKLF